jgi:hypothetical protein
MNVARRLTISKPAIRRPFGGGGAGPIDSIELSFPVDTRVQVDYLVERCRDEETHPCRESCSRERSTC